ncbi:MAG: hypothetical protein EA406_02240 [Rhodospirillales bacterium]|nr:MAG: hypothetical protein EA406_02240 [Rhodospirillales bacterium]
MLQTIAFEAALQYHPPDEIELRYNLPTGTFEQMLDEPRFSAMVAAARREIDETGAQTRLVAKRLTAQLVPEIARIVSDPRAAHRDRIDAFKALATVAGVNKDEANTGNAFAIQINLNQ